MLTSKALRAAMTEIILEGIVEKGLIEWASCQREGAQNPLADVILCDHMRTHLIERGKTITPHILDEIKSLD